MDGGEDSARVAASLVGWIDHVTFADLGTDEVTALLIDAVVAWATAQGWRSYRRAPSVLPLPAPYQHRHSCVDVGCARPEGAPIVVEVDLVGPAAHGGQAPGRGCGGAGRPVAALGLRRVRSAAVAGADGDLPGDHAAGPGGQGETALPVAGQRPSSSGAHCDRPGGLVSRANCFRRSRDSPGSQYRTDSAGASGSVRSHRRPAWFANRH